MLLCAGVQKGEYNMNSSYDYTQKKTKRYYWFKFKKDFFQQKQIRIIEGFPHGAEIILFYLKIMTESIETEGFLRVNETTPFNTQMLALICNTTEEFVENCMNIFLEFNMIKELEDKTLFLPEIQTLIGSETIWAEKKRIQRAKDNVPEMSGHCPTDINTNKNRNKDSICNMSFLDIFVDDEDIDADIRKKYGEYENVLLTDVQYQEIKKLFPSIYEKKIQDMSVYMKSHGKKYHDHFATLKNFCENENEKFSNNVEDDSSINFQSLQQKVNIFD